MKYELNVEYNYPAGECIAMPSDNDLLPLSPQVTVFVRISLFQPRISFGQFSAAEMTILASPLTPEPVEFYRFQSWEKQIRGPGFEKFPCI